MAAFLTQAWVDEFNAAVGGTLVEVPGDVASLAAASGRLTVLQQVHGVRSAPEGAVSTLLQIDHGTVRLSLVESATADVTVSLGYEDAAAMSRGELDPAVALGAGRINVRGDLSVLVAAQAVLTRSAAHLKALLPETSY